MCSIPSTEHIIRLIRRYCTVENRSREFFTGGTRLAGMNLSPGLQIGLDSLKAEVYAFGSQYTMYFEIAFAVSVQLPNALGQFLVALSTGLSFWYKKLREPLSFLLESLAIRLPLGWNKLQDSLVFVLCSTNLVKIVAPLLNIVWRQRAKARLKEPLHPSGLRCKEFLKFFFWILGHLRHLPSGIPELMRSAGQAGKACPFGSYPSRLKRIISRSDCLRACNSGV